MTKAEEEFLQQKSDGVIPETMGWREWIVTLGLHHTLGAALVQERAVMTPEEWDEFHRNVWNALKATHER